MKSILVIALLVLAASANTWNSSNSSHWNNSNVPQVEVKSHVLFFALPYFVNWTENLRGFADELHLNHTQREQAMECHRAINETIKTLVHVLQNNGRNGKKLLIESPGVLEVLKTQVVEGCRDYSMEIGKVISSMKNVSHKNASGLEAISLMMNAYVFVPKYLYETLEDLVTRKTYEAGHSEAKLLKVLTLIQETNYSYQWANETVLGDINATETGYANFTEDERYTHFFQAFMNVTKVNVSISDLIKCAKAQVAYQKKESDRMNYFYMNTTYETRQKFGYNYNAYKKSLGFKQKFADLVDWADLQTQCLVQYEIFAPTWHKIQKAPLPTLGKLARNMMKEAPEYFKLAMITGQRFFANPTVAGRAFGVAYNILYKDI